VVCSCFVTTENTEATERSIEMPCVSSKTSIDPVTRDALTSFKKILADRYGDHLKSLYLFGSRARGDHRPDSDADVAVFLNQVTDPIGEQFDLIDEGYEILLDTGVNIHSPGSSMRRAWQIRSTIQHQHPRAGLERPTAQLASRGAEPLG
jgi:predicted nucleotidyltransferase